MGLDQYAWVGRKPSTEHEDPEDFYWRKHSRLQQFMEDLWREKGCEGELNCNNLDLTEADLLALQDAVGKGYSDHFCEGGFFWGHQFQEEAVQEYKDEDTLFVTAALEAVREGKPVVYSCWW